MKIKGFVALFSAFSIFAFMGCAGLSQKESSASKSSGLLEPSTTQKFTDIPVPAGFKLLPQDSYAFESSGVRVGVLRYQGRGEADSVINFYREQMPIYNWTLLNIIEYGDRLMNFDRENETCIISLLPKGSSVTLAISFGPKPASSPKKPEKPVK